LKGGGFLNQEVNQWLQAPTDNWTIIPEYHFGGYGKTTDELISFQKKLAANHKITFDLIYGSKMMYGILNLISENFFYSGSTILAVHTGGLQGKY
jgi:1-aminocyclopropane-1-carboxylate deaminase